MHTRQRIASIAIGSILSATLAVAPLAAFAQTKGAPDHQDGQGHAAPAVQTHPNQNSDSIWNRFFSWFGNRAYAATTNSRNTGNDNDDRGNGGYSGYGNGGNGSNSGNTGSTAASANLPPVISGITSPTVLDTGTTGTWTVNASDPQNGSLTYSVNWGDSAVNPLLRFFAAAQQVFTQSATFTHAYAALGTYTATFTVKDSAGLTSQTSVTVDVTANNPAPVISNVAASSTRPRQATISWTTDLQSSTLVWYSTASPVDTSGTPQISRHDHTTSHSVDLTGLQPNTAYYVIVGSGVGANGQVTQSAQVSFTTPAAATNSNAPVIQSVTGPTAVTAGVSTTWTVNASNRRNSSLTYSVNWGDTPPTPVAPDMIGQQAFVQTATFSHEYANPGTYTATFTVQSSSGLSTSSSLTIDVTAASTTPVTTPPVISNVSASPASTTAAIAWDTDQAATSQAYYSTASPIDLTSGATPALSDASLLTSHSLDLSGMMASTTYYYVVVSANASGDISTSSQASFVTSTDN